MPNDVEKLNGLTCIGVSGRSVLNNMPKCVRTMNSTQVTVLSLLTGESAFMERWRNEPMNALKSHRHSAPEILDLRVVICLQQLEKAKDSFKIYSRSNTFLNRITQLSR